MYIYFSDRSDTPLIYKAVPSWFVRVENMVDKLLENNDKCYWWESKTIIYILYYYIICHYSGVLLPQYLKKKPNFLILYSAEITILFSKLISGQDQDQTK